MSFVDVLATEALKLRRSRVTVLSLLAVALGPLGGGLFMWIAREPERAQRMGLLGTKASLVGLDASWAGYFAMLTQMIGIVGGLVLAVIAAYVFGREYTEGTAKNMLALPVPRPWFVFAKLGVAAVWWLVLVVAVLAEGMAVAAGLHLPGFSAAVLADGVGAVALAAVVGFLLTPVVAWVATLGRGYLPPLGFAMLMLVLGNVFGATGWGKWFPWSIVPLFAGVAGPRVETLAPGSLVVVGLTCLVGVAATVAQVVYGDLDTQ
jgi:ABC-2 type transport system permease protein